MAKVALKFGYAKQSKNLEWYQFSRREDKKADLLFTASKNMINGRTSLRDHLIFDFLFRVGLIKNEFLLLLTSLTKNVYY